jgi:mRNA-degrading endonuclease RelE of RelBE toxin-antitoxin system
MNEESNFREIMANKSDNDLVEIVTKLRDDYQPKAIASADIELRNRNISSDKMEQIKTEIEQKLNKNSKKKTKENDETGENTQRIYSNKAIMGFSVLFATIFGGVLLMQNHKDIGNKKIANYVLIFSILYTTMTILIINAIEIRLHSLAYLLNYIGGVILTKLFYPKYFPKEQKFKYKKIWKPLIISIIIIIPFFLAAIYATND